MALVTPSSLKAFLGNNSFLTATPEPEGYGDAVSQADAIALAKIGMTEVELNAQVKPLVVFCACAYFVYITSTQQNLSKEEISQREKLVDRADKLLDDIALGKFKVSTPIEESTTTSTPGFYVSNRNEVV
ncbi:MAG: hypothetical protein A2499_05050 [Stygiobacter sp. RIFOXYC12_FULL_38_8]|nr:MAG: hypothetical protein A2299_16415 [Stygiobacter sp. RIFOXYB2_FULL_37_11]OGV13492.1 MAG: hypothetical protein A2237_17110 [Stygiobacter sp. RIFOXYA2_FULL_38_8]OGV14783.1 MAG: hypothetical protein A2440_09795 [Stygiobacter sp. RIFOXYC2_FULL_38_25]OGV22317.1 MAG: hypothetical protein A2499_05050 [Stygiobacter sp. RIFOXYC12_FULL_38_8]OGV79276.1 MAG: hypothetical protein A2X65_02165 [Stygiobacter sp. GWF2_38_21]